MKINHPNNLWSLNQRGKYFHTTINQRLLQISTAVSVPIKWNKVRVRLTELYIAILTVNSRVLLNKILFSCARPILGQSLECTCSCMKFGYQWLVGQDGVRKTIRQAATTSLINLSATVWVHFIFAFQKRATFINDNVVNECRVMRDK